MSAWQVVFLILEGVELLDLAGPLQVLTEMNRAGGDYQISLCAPTDSVLADQKLRLADLKPLSGVNEGDLIFIPGIPVDALRGVPSAGYAWLREAHRKGAKFYSICTGAFVLAEAGLLNGRQCTTHWTRTRDLQERYPGTRVIENRLFVTDGNITTSAGIAAGIDLTLSVVEQHYGSRAAASVAREMVIYMRRNALHKQESVYLRHRSHFHDGIHRVQDALVGEPQTRRTLAQLAAIANMSERNLTRVFRQTTGISIGSYANDIRLEMAKSLLATSELDLESIALQCGFEGARQLRRTVRKEWGISLSSLRRNSG